MGISFEERLKSLSYIIRGAAMEVYNQLGPGLLESIYEKALIAELRLRKIEVKSQVPIQVVYKGNVISNDLRIDLLINDTIIVELKSVEELNSLHYKQIRTYLKLTNKPLGWLINFNEDDFAHGMIKVPNRYFTPL
ncbi:MAG: GxxExxY protein [Bacteroidales bacterium]|nr:GxxExxY protein [Bacteroidales bacterium]